MTTLDRARLYRMAIFAPGAIGLIAFIAALARSTAPWSLSDSLLALFALAATLAVAFYATSLPRLRSRRVAFGAEGYVLDVPILAPLMLASFHGGEIAALAAFLGFSLAAYIRREELGFDILRHGVGRATLLLLVAAFVPPHALLSWNFLRFGVTTVVIAAAYEFAFAAPLLAIARNVSIRHTVLRFARTRGLWLSLATVALWASVDRWGFLTGGAALGVALWLPLPYVAWLRWNNDRLSGELARLKLVREAVAAMLAARDPLPQMRSILGSLRRALVDETLEIVTRTENKKKWQTVASLGPTIGEDAAALRARLLARLPSAERESAKASVGAATISVYAIRAGDALAGALLVHRKRDDISAREHQQFYQAARELAPLLIDLQSISEAHNAANTDPLTGVFNRRAILERLNAVVDDARHGAVLMLDIDRFKDINDRLGHAAGDGVLRRVADEIRAALRLEDALGRIGGEEFLVVMPDASRDVAVAIGERIRNGVARSDGGEHQAAVTISIGVATVRGHDRPAELLARADRALYEAKRLGRNRLVEEEQTA
uniref:GGDEF domain-containing protein n=1 Tax=mine drainage metagenome TaxID=410659 RepID=E6Q6E2_9ZZZZ